MAWTEEKIARLKELWAEGLSASMVAAKIGGISRNSVIGKSRRLGLPYRNPKNRHRSYVSKRQRRTTIPDRELLASRRHTKARIAATAELLAEQSLPALKAMASIMRETETPKPVIEITDYMGVSLLDLTPLCCRWPLNDPPRGEEFLFCGSPKRDGSVYCDEHHALAYEGKSRKPVYLPKGLVA